MYFHPGTQTPFCPSPQQTIRSTHTHTHVRLSGPSTTPEDLKRAEIFGQNVETRSRCSLLPPAAVENFGEAGHHCVLVLQMSVYTVSKQPTLQTILKTSNFRLSLM